MSTSVIVFNGPPGSGKDTAADFITLHLDANHVRFKDQLTTITREVYKVSAGWWQDHYTRDLKEVRQPELHDQSPREALIHVSENVVKPFFGADAFGKAATAALTPSELNVVSDGGFMSELAPLVAAVGQDNVLIVRLHRDGCDFSRDSRSYLPDRAFGCKFRNGTVVSAKAPNPPRPTHIDPIMPGSNNKPPPPEMQLRFVSAAHLNRQLATSRMILTSVVEQLDETLQPIVHDAYAHLLATFPTSVNLMADVHLLTAGVTVASTGLFTRVENGVDPTRKRWSGLERQRLDYIHPVPIRVVHNDVEVIVDMP